MTGKARPPARNKYDTFTEACQRMTRRWRREVIPEIAAWMSIARVRVLRQALHVKQAAQAGASDELRAAHAKLMMRADILSDLIRTLPDKWDDYLWWEIAKEVEDMIGPVPSKPNFNPTLPGMTPITNPVEGAPDGRTGRGDEKPVDTTGDRVHRPRARRNRRSGD